MLSQNRDGDAKKYQDRIRSIKAIRNPHHVLELIPVVVIRRKMNDWTCNADTLFKDAQISSWPVQSQSSPRT